MDNIWSLGWVERASVRAWIRGKRGRARVEREGGAGTEKRDNGGRKNKMVCQSYMGVPL